MHPTSVTSSLGPLVADRTVVAPTVFGTGDSTHSVSRPLPGFVPFVAQEAIRRAPLYDAFRHSAHPIHLICYYKETNEVHQSIDAFDQTFAPPIVVVCELNEERTNPCSVLSRYFVGDELRSGLNIGRHRKSGAPFLIYKKSEHEPRGKRYSHRIGVNIIRSILQNELDEVYVLFQDADTCSNSSSLTRMYNLARERQLDMIGASMICVNSYPWSVTGSYTPLNELMAVSERLIETYFFQKTRVISGSYALIKLTTYFEFVDQLCRPNAEMKMLEKVAYATEDTLLSYMMSGAGYKSHIVFDEVAWNLPQTYEELLKQRRRWINGEIACFLTARQHITWRLDTILFYLWSCFFFVKSHFIDQQLPLCMGLFLYSIGHPIAGLISAGFFPLQLITSTVFFRRNPDGLERPLKLMAHTYCMVSFLQVVAGFYLLSTHPALLLGTLTLFFLQALICLKGQPARRIYYLMGFVLHTLYSRGLGRFLYDYAIANLSDVTWGVRESVRDRALYGRNALGLSAITENRDIRTHLSLALTFQLLIPLLMLTLSIWFYSVWIGIVSIFAGYTILQTLLFFARAVMRYHMLDIFVMGPTYNIKERFVYGQEQSAGRRTEELTQSAMAFDYSQADVARATG